MDVREQTTLFFFSFLNFQKDALSSVVSKHFSESPKFFLLSLQVFTPALGVQSNESHKFWAHPFRLRIMKGQCFLEAVHSLKQGVLLCIFKPQMAAAPGFINELLQVGQETRQQANAPLGGLGGLQVHVFP